MEDYNKRGLDDLVELLMDAQDKFSKEYRDYKLDGFFFDQIARINAISAAIKNKNVKGARPAVFENDLVLRD